MYIKTANNSLENAIHRPKDNTLVMHLFYITLEERENDQQK